MRRSTAAILVVMATLTARDAAAQPSTKDLAAAGAIAATPVGTFTPLVLNKGWNSNGEYGLSGRYGMLSPKTGESNSSIGATGSLSVGSNAIVSATLGYTMVGCPSGVTCDNGVLLGGDVLSSLWSSASYPMHVRFQGSLGWSSFGDESALSAVVGAPLVWVVSEGRAKSTARPANGRANARKPAASSSSSKRISFFVTPAFGWGRLTDYSGPTSQSESGTRPLMSAGGQYITASGIGFNLGYSRIFIEDAANIFGLGVTYNVGRAPSTR